ncbi:MAG: sensor histidine kinase [Gemmataceae bacterium]
MTAAERRETWKYIRGLAPPVATLLLLVGWLSWMLYNQSNIWRKTDQLNLREWINEAVVFRKPLPELVKEYLDLDHKLAAQHQELDQKLRDQVDIPTELYIAVSELTSRRNDKALEIREHLRSLGTPTVMYQGQLPLFPVIYRLEVQLDQDDAAPAGRPDDHTLPLVWDSNLPRQMPDDGGIDSYYLPGPDGTDLPAQIYMEYQLHTFNRQQETEQLQRATVLTVSFLTLAAVLVTGLWAYFLFQRERQRAMQRLLAKQQIEQAEKLALENELRRQDAELKQEEIERQLLQQQLATQVAERQTLELKSQLFASIGIMAGSYAHNIKNLLVRPNDLLRRCLEADGLSHEQDQMLQEVQQTLGTVTERLQQILHTVRRDPSQPERTTLDLNDLLRELHRTWGELARDKWKLNLVLDLGDEPLSLMADRSHLQQAIENLLFNARDATFEMRNHLREQARKAPERDAAARRQAMIDAAAWTGEVILRGRRQDQAIVLEVQDNGIGMTEDTRRRCTETHFTTKSGNALYHGHSAGMGLGLSFVLVILDHHGAELDIESEPLRGARFRVRFPAGAPESTKRNHG